MANHKEMSADEIDRYISSIIGRLTSLYRLPEEVFQDFCGDAWEKYLRHKDRPKFSLNKSIEWSFHRSHLHYIKEKLLKMRVYHQLANPDYSRAIFSAEQLNPAEDDYIYSTTNPSRKSGCHFMSEFSLKMHEDFPIAKIDLKRFRESLNVKQKKLLDLFLQSYTQSEIAELLGTSRQNIQQRWCYLRIKAYRFFKTPLPADLIKYEKKVLAKFKKLNEQKKRRENE